MGLRTSNSNSPCDVIPFCPACSSSSESLGLVGLVCKDWSSDSIIFKSNLCHTVLYCCYTITTIKTTFGNELCNHVYDFANLSCIEYLRVFIGSPFPNSGRSCRSVSCPSIWSPCKASLAWNLMKMPVYKYTYTYIYIMKLWLSTIPPMSPPLLQKSGIIRK